MAKLRFRNITIPVGTYDRVKLYAGKNESFSLILQKILDTQEKQRLRLLASKITKTPTEIKD